ncbi:HypC/HybG/HupF family hydrogenase formation chaperone [Patescibacteria group bacterium]|nr:HypC/HybG/HupF family hydrogenase formation chaperone [Patescibacteria group bacterium]
MCLVIPSQIKKLKDNLAVVDRQGQRNEVKADLVKVKVGDWVFTQAGFIVQKLTKKEALKTLEYYENK